MSAAGKSTFHQPFWRNLFEADVIDPPIKGHEEKSIQQLQKILEKNESACFIFEPLILGSGGMIIYSAAGLNDLIGLCQQANVLTVADEVMTGFGRTGTLFACEQLEFQPDLMCLSKGLTGGFLPLGATCCTQQIFNAFLSDQLKHAFLHGHSYTANPLACSSALASLDLLLTVSSMQQRQMITHHHHSFCQQWKEHPKLKRCESLGTILVVEYMSQESSYFCSQRDQLYHFFLDHHILLRPLGQVLYVLPPYCIQPTELQMIYNHIILTLEQSHDSILFSS